MSDTFNSDDERYADDTFEQDSDTDVPEMGEIETEISDDDDDCLPSVKLNTSKHHLPQRTPNQRPSNYPNIRTPGNKTDAVPFDTSSDEEDDVIVGKTFAEINTPSMHLINSQTSAPSSRTIANPQHIKARSEDDVAEEDVDSEEEREFQKIRDMEERYIQQNSAKTPKTERKTIKEDYSDDQYTTTDAEIEAEIEKIMSARVQSRSSMQRIRSVRSSTKEATQDIISEQREEQTQAVSQVPPQQTQQNFMEILQKSITNLIAGQTEGKSPNNLNGQQLTGFNFDANHMLNPENIASALINAMGSANLMQNQNTLNQTSSKENIECPRDDIKPNEEAAACATKPQTGRCDKSNSKAEIYHGDEEHEVDVGSISPPPKGFDYASNFDDESYCHTQFEYEISSQPPSCFNSQDYVFHTNLIRPSPSSDKLRPKPQPRKSMSFSNERMREIERHNQILLKKILTQKPTYGSFRTQPKAQSIKPTPPQNGRMTTSALNRKKQQRQIDLDNQVLKRKIEAISHRRRPLMST